MAKSADREFAEQNGLTLREFQKHLHRAQQKRWTKAKLTPVEQKVWDFAIKG